VGSRRRRLISPFVIRPALALAAIALASCQSRPEPPRPSPTIAATPVIGTRKAPHMDMGGGEVRKPQPFTIEQRLLEAVRQNDRATIDRAVALGTRLTVKDDLGRSTVLLATLDAGNVELVGWLHEHGVPLDEPDNGGRTALSFAAERGNVPIVRYLVEHGARVDARDMQQRTPLFHAALSNEPDVVDALAAHGADLNARDQYGDTPLIVACAKGHSATAALLVKRGADATVRDQEGRTARERSAPEAEACRSLPR